MICILTKNDAKYLPRFLKEMDNLDYPKEKLRWVWLYGKSVDNTLDIILDFHKKRNYKYEVYEEPVIYRPIRSSLYNAELCNEFKKLYEEEDFILFPDTDLVKIPRNLLKEMVKLNLPICAPYVWIENSKPRQFFDTYVFRYKGQTFASLIVDGKKYDAWHPPFLDKKEPVEVDSVGTFILIRKEVFLEVNWDNPAPHYQFCKNARKKGYKVYALPWLEIEHADVLKDGEIHLPVEWYVAKGLLPRSELEKMRE